MAEIISFQKPKKKIKLVHGVSITQNEGKHLQKRQAIFMEIQLQEGDTVQQV